MTAHLPNNLTFLFHPYWASLCLSVNQLRYLQLHQLLITSCLFCLRCRAGLLTASTLHAADKPWNNSREPLHSHMTFATHPAMATRAGHPINNPPLSVVLLSSRATWDEPAETLWSENSGAIRC
jgi:hypothetical protein